MRVVVGWLRHLVLVIDLAIAKRLFGVENLHFATLLEDRQKTVFGSFVRRMQHGDCDDGGDAGGGHLFCLGLGVAGTE